MRRFSRVFSSVVPLLSISMSRSWHVLGVALVLCDVTSAVAGTVEIERNSGSSVKVFAESATVYDVVAKLSESHGFRLVSKGSAKVVNTTRVEQLSVDGQFEGTLTAVLHRLLAKESYFIEHRADGKAGISSVVLYNVDMPAKDGTVQAVSRAAPAYPSNAGLDPSPSTAVERYPQVAPGRPIIPPGLVPPIRRVQPAPPPNGIRPATSSAVPVQPQTAGPQPVGSGAPAPAIGSAVTGPVSAGAAPTGSAPLRRRGGVIQ
jgi:hypothetical protein